jgi:hypothetical protein
MMVLTMDTLSWRRKEQQQYKAKEDNGDSTERDSSSNKRIYSTLLWLVGK